MANQTHTKEERKQYFKELRGRWQEAKKQLDAGQIDAIQAIIKTHGMNISPMSFFFVSLQMQQQGMDGLPYLDAKTYKGWRNNGFQVKKGEKSTLSGITWIAPGKKDDDEDDDPKDEFLFPKEYHLFHRSQVDAA